MKKSLKFSLALVLIVCSLSAFAQRTPTTETAATKFPEADAFNNSKLTYKVTNSANQTFGYDIFADGKLLIRQTTVPGEPGMDGFKRKESAEKVAGLVIEKIKKGEMPPTVTKEEMAKLKVK